MNVVPPKPLAATDPGFYDDHYYARQLHARHWFRNNQAKFRQRWETCLRLLELGPDDVVLDLGCAAGEHTVQLAPLCRRAVGVDFSEAAVRVARERAAAVGSSAEFQQADVARLSGFADGSVQRVVALDLLEHIEDDTLQSALSEAWRVLAPGGRFVFYTPSATHYVERMKAANFILRQLPGHIAVRSGEHYREALARQAWSTVRLHYLPSTYPVFGLVDRALMRLPKLGAYFRFRVCGVAVK